MSSLIDKTILVLDGGLGTTLEDQHAIKFSDDTPLWSSQLLISEADTLLTVQRSFVAAGADILLTPTYQISDAGFEKSGIADCTHYLERAIRITNEAGEGQVFVALGLGAYGATMRPSQEFSGGYDVDEHGLMLFHAQRLARFAPYLAGVQIVAFETIPRIDEVRAIKRAYQEQLPYWISCVFPDSDRLPDGSSVEELLSVVMEGSRPWAIGMNCTKVTKLASLVEQFERAAEQMKIQLPRLVMYPDGTNGVYFDVTAQEWIGEDMDDIPWEEQVCEVVKVVQTRGKWAGIIVGGCCKASPEHIRRLKQRLDRCGLRTGVGC